MVRRGARDSGQAGTSRLGPSLRARARPGDPRRTPGAQPPGPLRAPDPGVLALQPPAPRGPPACPSVPAGAPPAVSTLPRAPCPPIPASLTLRRAAAGRPPARRSGRPRPLPVRPTPPTPPPAGPAHFPCGRGAGAVGPGRAVPASAAPWRPRLQGARLLRPRRPGRWTKQPLPRGRPDTAACAVESGSAAGGAGLPPDTAWGSRPFCC